ncbi:hypothetical protein HNR42_002743 [Deinobacterium chartae]|uniref:Uncharacterized protein n=1 Tax=Deinobacterium chartae TaxID=521158 RepID=A0A841I614_9DEIO|nr:hypothetical protein [Deinobacterium chartae]MBB6099305.1 hypothetical protein [Deinobacterium chartae]
MKPAALLCFAVLSGAAAQEACHNPYFVPPAGQSVSYRQRSGASTTTFSSRVVVLAPDRYEVRSEPAAPLGPTRFVCRPDAIIQTTLPVSAEGLKRVRVRTVQGTSMPNTAAFATGQVWRTRYGVEGTYVVGGIPVEFEGVLAQSHRVKAVSAQELTVETTSLMDVQAQLVLGLQQRVREQYVTETTYRRGSGMLRSVTRKGEQVVSERERLP